MDIQMRVHVLRTFITHLLVHMYQKTKITLEMSAKIASVKRTSILLRLAEVNNNLATAEAKCNLLERQLEYMRKMLQSAEVDRNDAIQRSTTLAQQAAKQASQHVQSKLEKISGLERQHIQLNAAQNVAEVMQCFTEMFAGEFQSLWHHASCSLRTVYNRNFCCTKREICLSHQLHFPS